MITAVVLTKNEEKNIPECIRALSWCDEIVVVDDGSEDKTITLLEKTGDFRIKIYKHNLNDNFAEQRNFGLAKAMGDWVLFIDADERVTDSLQYEILSSINASVENIAGYYIVRRDVLWGRKIQHGEAGKTRLLRLARKDSGKWNGKVHEIWDIEGRRRELANPLIHYPHQNIASFLRELNYYTSLRAEELYAGNVKADYKSVLWYPCAKFIQNYFIKLGFLDGVPGLILSIMMSFHSFLVRGKLWLLWQR